MQCPKCNYIGFKSINKCANCNFPFPRKKSKTGVSVEPEKAFTIFATPAVPVSAFSNEDELAENYSSLDLNAGETEGETSSLPLETESAEFLEGGNFNLNLSDVIEGESDFSADELGLADGPLKIENSEHSPNLGLNEIEVEGLGFNPNSENSSTEDEEEISLIESPEVEIETEPESEEKVSGLSDDDIEIELEEEPEPPVNEDANHTNSKTPPFSEENYEADQELVLGLEEPGTTRESSSGESETAPQANTILENNPSPADERLEPDIEMEELRLSLESDDLIKEIPLPDELAEPDLMIEDIDLETEPDNETGGPDSHSDNPHPPGN